MPPPQQMSNSAQTVYGHRVQYTVQEPGQNPVITSLKALLLPRADVLMYQSVIFRNSRIFLGENQTSLTHTHTHIKYTQQFSEWEPKKWIMEIVVWKPVIPRKR